MEIFSLVKYLPFKKEDLTWTQQWYQSWAWLYTYTDPAMGWDGSVCTEFPELSGKIIKDIGDHWKKKKIKETQN